MLERGTKNALTVRLWREKMQHHGITANAAVIVEVFIVYDVQCPRYGVTSCYEWKCRVLA